MFLDLALKLFEPDFEAVQIPFDKIMGAVADRTVDAGLVIHEGQLTFDKGGFHSVIDLGRIPGLNQIAESTGIITIGAMTTHHAVETSPLIRGKIPLLAETASQIGDIQVRNMGTIGGSIAHADPAASGTCCRWHRQKR